MKHFIICQNPEVAQKLRAEGFKMIKSENQMYVFLNNEKIKFDFSKLELTTTDRLNFWKEE
jgi:hypothetical protein